MVTTASLGIRPTFDLTSRISIMVALGIYFRHSIATSDRWVFAQDEDAKTSRYSETSDTIGLFGYYGIESIGFMFRF
jgi:hypothetical protein